MVGLQEAQIVDADDESNWCLVLKFHSFLRFLDSFKDCLASPFNLSFS